MYIYVYTPYFALHVRTYLDMVHTTAGQQIWQYLPKQDSMYIETLTKLALDFFINTYFSKFRFLKKKTSTLIDVNDNLKKYR